MRFTGPALAILILISSAAGAQELTIVSKVTSGSAPAATMTSYIAPDRVRAVQADGSEAMFDLKSGTWTVIDTRKKTYWVMTQKDMDDAADMIKKRMNSPEMKQAMEQMKNLPPEQQKRVQEMMGGMFAVNVEKESTTRTIAGYKCQNWIITIGQISRTEQCMTTELKMPETWQGYKKFADNMRAMMSAMGPMAGTFDKMRAQMEKIKGFPLASKSTTSIMGRENVYTTEVTSITRGPVPASAWQIPAGYKKVDNPMQQATAKIR